MSAAAGAAARPRSVFSCGFDDPLFQECAIPVSNHRIAAGAPLEDWHFAHQRSQTVIHPVKIRLAEILYLEQLRSAHHFGGKEVIQILDAVDHLPLLIVFF